MIKFVDLFSGTGGIRLGFEQAMSEIGVSTECIKSSEIDKKSCETYQLNFNEDSYCDVHDVDIDGHFDVLLAGFPCQAFSYAGKQLGFSDTRGTLFFEIERIIKKNKPKLCLLENVRGLTTHDKGRTFSTILKSLQNLGYHVEYRLLNTSNFGIPQNRVRIYIIASLKKDLTITIPSDVGAKDSHNHNTNLLSHHLYKESKVSDILELNPDDHYDCSDWFKYRLENIFEGDMNKVHGIRLIDTRNGNSLHSWDLGLKGICSNEEINFMNKLISNRRKHTFGTHQDGKALSIEQIKTFFSHKDTDLIIESLISKGYLKEKNGLYNPVCGNMSFEVFKFLDPNKISITLTASDANRLGVYYNGRLRRLTPRECARLQGYPDSYILHPKDSLAYKQLGNAVSVPVIKNIFMDIMNNNKDIYAKSRALVA